MGLFKDLKNARADAMSLSDDLSARFGEEIAASLRDRSDLTHEDVRQAARAYMRSRGANPPESTLADIVARTEGALGQRLTLEAASGPETNHKSTKRRERPVHGTEQHDRLITRRLNALRAGVLGGNDGLVSIAALVVGVAAATIDSRQIAVAGFAGLAAGALSMAAGEYVSVSSQRDAEDAQLSRERKWHVERPEWELEQLVRLNKETGMSEKVARIAAKEQTAHDPLLAHARLHLGISDPAYLTSPVQAGVVSLLAFCMGGTIPILSILLAPESIRIPLTFAIAIVCVAGTGWLASRIAHSSRSRAMIRNVIGGSVALAVTYGIGALVGTAV